MTRRPLALNKPLNLIPSFVRRRMAHRPNLLKIADNIGWLFLDKVLRMGVGLLVGVWIARYLGPEQFGLLNFVMAFVGLFTAIATMGLQGIVVRDIVRNPDGAPVTLGSAALLQCIGGVVAYGLVLAVIFGLRPDDPLAKILVAITGSMMLFKFAEIAVYWFESQVQSKYTVWVQNGVFLVFAAIKVALILNEAPLVAFAWVTAAEAILVAVILLWVMGRRGPALSALRVQMGRVKRLLRDSWPLMLSSVSIVVYMKIDQIMLGQMVDDKAVGIYSAAVRISEVWYFVPMAIVASVFPAILQAKKRSETQYYARLQKLFDLMVWLSIAVALPMTFLSDTIVILLFGHAYAEAGLVLSIHIWSGVFIGLGVVNGRWFLAEDMLVLRMQRAIFGAFVNLQLNFLMIPLWGVQGAAIATLVSYASSNLFFDFWQKETQRIFFMKLFSLGLCSIYKKIT